VLSFILVCTPERGRTSNRQGSKAGADSFLWVKKYALVARHSANSFR